MNNIAKRANKLAVVIAALLGAPSAFAATVNVDLDTGTAGVQATRDLQPGQSATSTINFVGDGATTNTDGTLTYDTTLLDATVTSAAGALCGGDDASGTIAFTTTSASGTALGDQAVCNVTFTATGAIGTTATLTFGTTNFPGGSGTTAGGTINIVAAPAGPTAPTIALSPNPVNLPAGSLGTTQTGTVTIDTPVDATGTGNATVACTIPAGFTVSAVTGNPFTTGTGSVDVGCTLGAAATSATLTCTATAGGGAPAGTTQATTVVNCPAGTVAPEFDANLSATLVGAPSSTASGTIGINNTGTGPLTISCGAPSAGFTVTSPPAASVAAGGSTSIGISCAVPAGGATTGSLVCTTNDTSEGTVTFALSCVAQAIAVPTMGGFAKGMLAAMLAAVGLLGFALRRKLV